MDNFISKKNDYIYDKYADYNEKVTVTPEILSMLSDVRQHISIAEMNQFVISDNERTVLGTVGLAVCDGIIIYDRNNKWGMVGHAAGDGKLSLLSEMINCLPTDKEITIEFAIVTGYDNVHNNNYTDTNEMIKYLKSNCPTNVTLIPLTTDLGVRVGKGYGNEFLFDVKNGISVSKILDYYNYLLLANDNSYGR